jgi:DNA modification methylase
VEHLVEVLHAVKRTLRNNGNLWLNLGDSYSQGGGKQVLQTKNASHGLEGMRAQTPNMPSKQLLGIPWRVALALQADGWWLRSSIIWEKSNCMPSSARDRPTTSHEYIFLLAKSKRYYYDQDAIREPAQSWGTRDRKNGKYHSEGTGLQSHSGLEKDTNPAGRNKRTVWTIPTKPFRGAHFAVFPPALIEPCILAGTSKRGVCPECGAPRERVVEKDVDYSDLASGFGKKGSKWKEQDSQSSGHRMQRNMNIMRAMGRDHDNPFPKRTTIGWRPTCGHDAEPIPATVLDPFIGSGTTAIVAHNLGRDCIGIDLSETYIEDIAIPRIEKETAQMALC